MTRMLPVSIYMCVTGQYHKSSTMSRPNRSPASPRVNATDSPSVLKRASLYLLRLIIGLGVTVMLGGSRSPALDMVFEQFQIISPWQWLSLVTVGTGLPRPAMSRARAGSVAATPSVALAHANDNTPAGEVARAS